MALKGLSLGSPIIGNEANYAAAFATDIAGFRSVPTVADLYNIKAYILSHSGNNTNNDAIGQIWRVTNNTADTTKNGEWRLKDWSNHGAAAGWEQVKNATAGDLSSLTTRVGTAETNIKNLQSTTGTHTSQINTINNTLGTINTTQLAGLKTAHANNIVSDTSFISPTSAANNLKCNYSYIDATGAQKDVSYTFPVATATTVGLMSNSDKAIVNSAITKVGIDNDTVVFYHNNDKKSCIMPSNGIQITSIEDEVGISLDSSYFPYVSIGVGSSLTNIDDTIQIVDIVDNAAKEQLDINLVFNSAYFSLTSTRADGEPEGSPWYNGEMTLNKTWVDSLATVTALKATDTKAANAATAAANAQSTANRAKTTAEAAKGVTDTLTTNGYLKASGATYTPSSRTLSFPNSKGTNTNVVLPEADEKNAGLLSATDYSYFSTVFEDAYTYRRYDSIWYITIENKDITASVIENLAGVCDGLVFNKKDHRLYYKHNGNVYNNITRAMIDMYNSMPPLVVIDSNTRKLYSINWEYDTENSLVDLTEISPSDKVASIISVTGIEFGTEASTTSVRFSYTSADIKTGQTATAKGAIEGATTTKAGVMTTAQVTQLNKATQDITNISSNVSSITKLSDQEIINQVTAGWA